MELTDEYLKKLFVLVDEMKPDLEDLLDSSHRDDINIGSRLSYFFGYLEALKEVKSKKQSDL